KTARAVVISGRNITPAVQTAVTTQGGDVITVVDGIGMFIKQHQQVCGRTLLWVGRFSPPHPIAQRGTIVVRARKGIHRDAAGPISPSLGALNRAEVDVRGASINIG